MPRQRKPFRVGRSHTGLGLFATVPIEKGTLIVEYKGRRIPTKEAWEREARFGCKYMFEINSRWTLDGSNRKNLARYANHACRPNTEAELLRGRIMLRAIKTIAPGHEITLDYGPEYFDLFLKAAGCKCTTCAAKRDKKRRTQTIPGLARRARGSAGKFRPGRTREGDHRAIPESETGRP
jgi:SET domain-containing protein